LHQGVHPAEVVRQVGVHRQSVSRWERQLKQGGVRALKQAGRAGHRARLRPEHLRRIERGLKRGPGGSGVRNQPMDLIVWDGLPGHRSRATWDFIRQQGGRLWVEFLPAYAPELNPVEYLWSHWKQHVPLVRGVERRRGRRDPTTFTKNRDRLTRSLEENCSMGTEGSTLRVSVAGFPKRRRRDGRPGIFTRLVKLFS
jgi:hypothetical protein